MELQAIVFNSDVDECIGNMHTNIQRKRDREKDVGITCVIIYDDLALEAWNQSNRERKGEIEKEKEKKELNLSR